MTNDREGSNTAGQPPVIERTTLATNTSMDPSEASLSQADAIAHSMGFPYGGGQAALDEWVAAVEDDGFEQAMAAIQLFSDFSPRVK